MLIAGIFFLVSAQTDTRGADIAKYNKAVDAWTSTTPGGPFASFQTLSNTAVFDVVDISDSPNANPTRSLGPDTSSSSEIPSVEAGAGINPYTQRLIMSGNNVVNQPFPTISWPPSNNWLATIGFRISGTSRTTKWLNLTSIPVRCPTACCSPMRLHVTADPAPAFSLLCVCVLPIPCFFLRTARVRGSTLTTLPLACCCVSTAALPRAGVLPSSSSTPPTQTPEHTPPLADHLLLKD